MDQSDERAVRQRRARLSLAGLSVGDALGERFFGLPDEVMVRIRARQLPKSPWRYTDDTEMALSIVDVLGDQDGIDPDTLALRFAERYDPSRGYGGGAHRLLQSYQRGVSWKHAAPEMFGGTGSYGNGAAMRAAPIGGYFADDMGAVVKAATRAAKVTHSHHEGIAGGIAVAVAAAVAWQLGEAGELDPDALLARVIRRTPSGDTHRGLEQAAEIPPDTAIAVVAERLGTGQEISAQDTVPFAVWCAAHHLGSFEEAFWTTVEGLGDRDTTCAMAGGIVALSSREIPAEWISRREPLPAGF